MNKFHLLVLLWKVHDSVGFTMTPKAICERRCDTDWTSACNLLPTDAEKLVEAANNGGVLPMDDEDELNDKKEMMISPLTAGRSLISRLFQLPSNPRTLNSNSDQEMDYYFDDDDDKDDVVLYPIVGFQWFMDENNQCRALPTSQRASCFIPPSTKDMELVGWFHPPEKNE